MSGAFAALTILLYFRDTGLWPFSAALSVFFLIAARFSPAILSPVEKGWMKLAAVMGFIMTNVLLTLVFFIAIVPTGLIMRLLRKAPLKLAFSRKSKTYWTDVDPEGPCGRPEKPY